MNKSILLILSLCFVVISYSQESRKELTDAEKVELRKNHDNSPMFIKKIPGVKTTNLKTTNTQETDVEVTTKVTYYYGKEDSLYKKFEYIKRD